MSTDKLNWMINPLKQLLLAPLILLNGIANLYSVFLRLLRPGLGNAWLEGQAEKNRQLTQKVLHPLNGGGS